MKVIFFSVFVFGLLIFFMSIGLAKTYEPLEIAEFEVNFSYPTFYEYLGYDIVKINDTQVMLEPGKPMLPMKTISIEIPSSRVEDINIISYSNETISGFYRVFPAQPLTHFLRINEPKFTLPDSDVYSSSSMFPGVLFKEISVSKMRDKNFLGIIVFPIQYQPKDGRLIFHEKIRFAISYSKETMVIQKTMSRAMLPQIKTPLTSLDYVIITDDEFESEFQRLADWKTKKGVPSIVVTTSFIKKYYSGIDTQETIRNFIKHMYDSWSIRWVLLGGDDDLIPDRKAYGRVLSEEGLIEDDIVADLYYSDLDGNWDEDGDSIYGEVEDNINLYPDVFVGRATVNSVEEARVFVDKVLTYERNPPKDYLKKSLMIAGLLDTGTDCAVLKDMIDGESIPNDFHVLKLYESFGNLTLDLVKNNLNEGYGIIDHANHANYNTLQLMGSHFFSSSDADKLNNKPMYFIFYSIGCGTNAFDTETSGSSGSISEHFIRNQNGGAIAYVGNTRYGWYEPNFPGWGPSEMYDKQFFYLLFNGEIYHIGETFAISKSEFIPVSGYDSPPYDAYRWIQYSLNLLGDPEMPIWTDESHNLIVSHPSEIHTGPVSLPVKVMNETYYPVSNATVTLLKDGEIYIYSKTNSTGDVVFNVVSETSGTISIVVTKHNFIPYESNIVIPTVTTTVMNYTREIEQLKQRVEELETEISILGSWIEAINSTVNTMQTMINNILTRLTDVENAICSVHQFEEFPFCSPVTTSTTTVSTTTTISTCIEVGTPCFSTAECCEDLVCDNKKYLTNACNQSSYRVTCPSSGYTTCSAYLYRYDRYLNVIYTLDPEESESINCRSGFDLKLYGNLDSYQCVKR